MVAGQLERSDLAAVFGPLGSPVAQEEVERVLTQRPATSSPPSIAQGRVEAVRQVVVTGRGSRRSQPRHHGTVAAHLVPTALEHFRRFKEFIRANPALESQVLKIRETNGGEAIEFLTGARLLFMARSKGGRRGFSGDVLVLDESQEMPAAAMEALGPTLLAQPNGQICYAGTVPAAVNDCEYWTSVRDRGRAGGDPDLAWLEWSPHPNMKIDERAVPMANPSLGYRVKPQTIEWQRSMLGADAFGRESLSIW